jgi:dienelactone hydrolase
MEELNYEAAGRTFVGFVADGSGGRPAPGILVAHEGSGMTDHPRERARMLAELGYVAYALDLFGEVIHTPEQAYEMIQTLSSDLPTLRGRATAGLQALCAHPNVDATRLGAVGFCFGGSAMLELARSGADLRCVVGFHPALATTAPHDARNIRGKVLVCLGAEDPIILPAERDGFGSEMGAAGVDWQLLLFGGVGHSFTNREVDALGMPGFAYDATADARSWHAMRGLFDEVLAAH